MRVLNIHFVHISGKDNVLADRLSRLIDIDPDLAQQPELQDYKFGKYCFDTFFKVRGSAVHQKIMGEGFDICEIQITYNNEKNLEFSIELLLEDDKFVALQEHDLKIWELQDKVLEGMYGDFYLVKNNIYLSVL